ncbi:kinase-like protein [Panus rudis PR-1116 ss-1]|nr:kinase-like protein [Panus rudis PR-1116 ss-1]
MRVRVTSAHLTSNLWLCMAWMRKPMLHVRQSCPFKERTLRLWTSRKGILSAQTSYCTMSTLRIPCITRPLWASTRFLWHRLNSTSRPNKLRVRRSILTMYAGSLCLVTDGSHRIQTGCIDSLAPLPDMEDYRGFGLSGTVSPNATYHSVCKQSLHGQSSVSSSAAHRKGAMSSRSDNDADTGASPRDSFFFSKDSPSNHNSPTQPPSVTDSRYNYAEGDLIAGEYLPQGLIGTDLDSTQVHACHQRTGEAVMLKIKHAIDVEVDPELAVYDSMKDCSATIRSCFHQLICTTFHGAHRVLVLEGVGPSLQEYLLYNHMRPFCDRHVREIARQLVCGLKALHDLGYAHLNIRPSSVFFRDGQQSKLMYMARGIQFAPRYLLRSAELVIGGLHQAIIVNEHLQSAGYNGEISIYEAPELTIKAPWSPAVDSFSLGCLLFELVHDGPRHQQNTARVISRCIEI